jgi:hypothetical protein
MLYSLWIKALTINPPTLTDCKRADRACRFLAPHEGNPNNLRCLVFEAIPTTDRFGVLQRRPECLGAQLRTYVEDLD